MTEQWGFVDWAPRYSVSDRGNVRGIRRAKLELLGARYLSCSAMDASGKKRTLHVHIEVLRAFVGECPAGHWARHLDGDSKNNRLTNLKWGTPLENAADKRIHGTARGAYGEGHGCAKLTEEQVRYIRRARVNAPFPAGKMNPASIRQLAKRFNVSQTTIQDAWHGVTWAHITA